MSVRRLDSTGEPVFGRLASIITTGSEEVVVTLALRLKVMKEEWFLDQSVYVGWVDLGSGDPRIFGGSADPRLLESELKRVILGTPGVSALLDFQLIFDHDTRRARVTGRVADVYGEALPIDLVLP